MSSQQLQFYEQKIISDKEFPIEVFMNQVQDKCQYFHTHWHEHIALRCTWGDGYFAQSDQVYLSTRRSCCH